MCFFAVDFFATGFFDLADELFAEALLDFADLDFEERALVVCMVVQRTRLRLLRAVRARTGR